MNKTNFLKMNGLKHSLAVFAVLVVLFSSIIGILYVLKPTITGLVVVTEQLKYSDVVNLEFTESGIYTWTPENQGNLKSIRVDGIKTGQGIVKAYIENKNIRYLIFDSGQLFEESPGVVGITGLVVGNITLDDIVNGGVEASIINESDGVNETVFNETPLINESVVNKTIINESDGVNETANQIIEEKTINIKLDYKTGTNWDIDNDGMEGLEGVIDFTVEDSEFNWDLEEEKLCTRWVVYSEEDEESAFICHGSTECCAFVELQPTLYTWNSPFDLYKGRFYESKKYVVGAQLIYVDIDLENLQYDMVYSETETLPSVFEEGLILFDNACIDTCSISGFDKESYNLVIVIENATLKIEEIKYTIEKKLPKITKPQENIVCKEFKDNVLWSSGYSQKERGSTTYQTWYPKINCTGAGGNNCSLHNITVETRFIYPTPIDVEFDGEGYVQISEPDQSICDNPQEGTYSKYLAYETLKEDERKTGKYCGENKNPNSRCSTELSGNYKDDVNCYGIKSYASQYSITDTFEVSYSWCWKIKDEYG